MTDAGRFPNLVERALRYLSNRADATEADLCAHLFGASGVGPWSRLLAQVLGADERLDRRPDGRWFLRANADAAPVGLPATELVALAIVAAGAKPWRHPLLGVVALRFLPADPAGAAIWQAVINPGRPLRLPDYVAAKGIAEEEVAAAPTFAAVASDLLAFVGDRPLIGLDVGLAAAWIQQALREVGRPPLTNPLIDVASLARLALGAGALGGKPDAATLAALADVPPPDERRLESDARVAARIASRLIRRLPADVATLADLLATLGRMESRAPTAGLDASRRRVLLDAALASDLPTGPGVYLFRDEIGRALYVGKATSLRRRLTSYLTSDVGRVRRMPGLVEATDEIETRPSATELEARLLEARLIAAEAPRYNTQARAGVELAYLRREPAAAAPRAKGDPRRPAWAIVSTSFRPLGGSEFAEDGLGPLAATEARRLLRDATDRFHLSGGKRDAAWSARADAAWSEVIAASAATPVAGNLRAADLTLFAALAPWPTTSEPADSEELAPSGHLLSSWASWRRENAADLPALLPTDGPRPDNLDADGPTASWSTDADEWSGINQDWRAEAEARTDDLHEAEDAEPRGPLLLLNGAIRAVVCGRGGYLGGLTIAANSTVEQVTAALGALAGTAGHAEATSTSLAELGVALAEVNRRWVLGLGETVLPLGDSLETAAARLLVTRDRLVEREGNSTA